MAEEVRKGQWRRFVLEIGGTSTEGARIETPKAPRAIGCGEGCPLPCLLYTSPSPRDRTRSRMPSSA